MPKFEIILPGKEYLAPCFGIARALEKCLALKNSKKFVIYGLIAHNKELCGYLRKKGFVAIDSLKRIGDRKVIIKAHGTSKKDLEFLKKDKIKFIDLTCPFVKRLLNLALSYEKKGYRVVIIADKKHAETKNICSFLREPIIVGSIKEAVKIPCLSKAVVLTQTTQTLDKINEILPVIRRKCKSPKNVVFISTRCPETESRQEKAVEIAGKSDLVLVIGDRISKNANNLVDVCRKISPAELIRTSRDIDKIPAEAGKIGIIASASTPLSVSEGVIKCLKNKK